MGGHKLPPSRPGYPLLGNVLEIPSSKEHIVYHQWSKELNSDLIYVNAAGTPIVVLDNIQLALDMLEGRSSIYSSRPGSIMLMDLMGWDWPISNLPYGSKWRERRKLFQRHLSPANNGFLRPYTEEQLSHLLIKLYNSPERFLDHIRHMVGALAISFTFGLPVQPENDPYIVSAETAIKSSADAVVPGAFYVDFLPFLRYVPEWMPGAGFKRKAKDWRAQMQEMRDKPFEDCEKRLTEGIAPPSFVLAALDGVDSNKDMAYQREVIIDTAGMVFSAAADTTTSALGTFFLAMMCYPKVQKRAQEELDKVLGGRIPEPQEVEELGEKVPYMSAIVKEVLRWKPATPISVPHRSTKDDIFNGYFIPKGTIIISNAWAMLHNEQDFPNPEEFIPERFLNPDGTPNAMVRDPSTMAFGFGRRTCPGAHIARSTLWLTAASILTLFDISKPIISKANGKAELVEPSMEYGVGIVSHPEPFQCAIKPRSKRTEVVVRNLHASRL